MQEKPNGIDIELLKQVKINERKLLNEYAARRGVEIDPDLHKLWTLPCDIALPCATATRQTARACFIRATD